MLVSFADLLILRNRWRTQVWCPSHSIARIGKNPQHLQTERKSSDFDIKKTERKSSDFDKNYFPYNSNQRPCIVQQKYVYEISKLVFYCPFDCSKIPVLRYEDKCKLATWELVTFCLDEIKGLGLSWCFWCVVIVNLRNLQVWCSKKGTLLIFGSTIKDAKKKRFLSVEISIIHHIIMSWSQFLVQLGIVWHVCPFFGCLTFALILMVSKDVDSMEWVLI